MKKVFSVIFAVIFVFSSFFSVKGEEISTVTESAGEINLALSAESVILTEQTTGTVLYEKNADTPLPIASVTKVMTLLIVVEAIDSGIISLDEKVSVSERAASMGGSQMYLEVGEEISVCDLLKAVFVASANDGAVALAEHIAGSLEAFVDKMNKRAEELGMTSAVFYNPTGLDDLETNLVSARDVATMSNALLSHEIIYQFTKIWTDSLRDGKFGLANTNKLIRFYPGATGLKTGSTSKAKYCLSASAERNGLRLCAVVLGAPSTKERFSDAKTLLDYGFAGWSFFVPENFPETEIKVWGGKEKSVKLSANVSGMLVKKENASGIASRTELADSLSAPVEKNQSVGKVIFEKNGEIIREVPILTLDGVEKMSKGDIFIKLLKLVLFKKA